MPETKSDTVPGLGFKDKDKALETIKNLEGRDPDYQRLAIKGLIGRAKRTLTLTKDEEKLQNINAAMSTFDEWLKNFENCNLSKENRPYLPLPSIETMLSLKTKYDINDKKSESFFSAYKSVKGEYKNLRTVSSGENEPTWDIIRNTELKGLLKKIDEDSVELWDDDLPTKEHMEIILWAYSPDANRIKKNLGKIQEKIGKSVDETEESVEEDETKCDKSDEKKIVVGLKRHVVNTFVDSSDDSDEGSPIKISKKH